MSLARWFQPVCFVRRWGYWISRVCGETCPGYGCWGILFALRCRLVHFREEGIISANVCVVRKRERKTFREREREGGRCVRVWTRPVASCQLCAAACWRHGNKYQTRRGWEQPTVMAGVNYNQPRCASSSWSLCAHNTLTVSSGSSSAIWPWTLLTMMRFSLKKNKTW